MADPQSGPPSSKIKPATQRVRLGERARSVPYKRPFVEAILFTVVFYLSLAATTTVLFTCFALQQTATAKLLGISIGASAVLWLFSFLRRRAARCPLCKGTPLADSGAHKHVEAKRFFPLNYGTSNVVRSIITQKFIYPYCGTPFDLLKQIDKQGRG